MKLRTVSVTLGLAMLLMSTVALAADVASGTWKLNEAKSHLAAGGPKNDTVKIETSGDQMKVTVDGTDAAGKPTHNEWTGKDDGKDYPVTGDPNTDMRSYKKTGARSWAITTKKDGKVRQTGTVTISADGKTRTVKISGTGADGKHVSSMAVYEKQ